MLKNYLTIIYRNLFKQRTSSLINITGMAIAIAGCLFILLFIFDELQFDQFNTKKDRVYRLVFQNKDSGETSSLMPAALYPIIMNEIPEFEDGFRISRWMSVAVQSNQNVFSENVFFADQELFNVLTFSLQRGELDKILKNPFSIIITPTIAKKYFGNSNPIGKKLKFSNKLEFKVTGILKEVPQHSSLRPNLIASINSLKTIEPEFFTDMRMSGAYFYFLLNKNASIKLVNNKLEKIFKEQFGKDSEFRAGLQLESLNNIYLYSSDTKWEIVSHGNIKYVRSFVIIAILILIMASFNYTNLLSVNVKAREKEFAVRKMLGADRKNIISQFLLETISYLIISLISAIVLVDLLMNQFNQLTGKHFEFASLFQWEIVLSIIGLLFLTTLSSIIYPSVIAFTSDFLSRLKGSSFGSRFQLLKMQFGFRQIVTWMQFIITIALIAAVIIIFTQLNFMLNKNLGFNKEHLLTINNPYDKDMYTRFEEFKNMVSQNPQVLSVSAGTNVPSQNLNNFTQAWIKGKKINNGIHSAQVAIDYDYLKTLQAKFISGRDFSRYFKTDENESVILNQSAVKELNLINPIGAELSGINNASDPQKVIGVIEDIHFESFKDKIPPVIFYLRQWSASNILLRLKGDNILSTMNYLENVWKKVNTNQPFIFSFLDQSYDSLYKSEKQTGTLILIFCFFAIVISCIGLFSIVSLLVQTRRKEIGIRKVLGASIFNAFSIMIREYILLIIAANIIAIPIAYYFMNNWLKNFAYKIEIGWWIFALSGIIAIIIALLTVSIQAIKAAVANPVESLRYE